MSRLAKLVPQRGHTQQPGRPTGSGWSISGTRRWFVGLLADYHWWVLAVAGVIAFVLGCIGWWKYPVAGHPTGHPTLGHGAFVAYWSFKNFLMPEFPDERAMPWELHVARFLAPIVAGWAGLSALGLLFRDRVQQMGIPLMHGHVVICGLGKYVGIVFLRHLREKHVRVVVVEFKADNPNIELCRSLGVPVIVGDAQRLKTLQAAGAHRARRVLAVTDDDGINTQIVATWRELPGRRTRQLGCLARITDPQFCSLLRIQEAQREDESSVDFFNIDEISARLMLKEFPIATDYAQPHILVAHLDPLGVWLVYHAARAWHAKRGRKTAPLMVTIVDRQPEESIQALKSQHPQLKNMCDFKQFYATAEDIGERLPRHHLDSATPHIGRAYVTAYTDQQAFETALRLHHGLHRLDPPVPVTVALSSPHGVASLLGDVKRAGALADVDVFPTMERACTVELVQGGSLEPLAEEIHERWREQQRKEHKPAPSWKDLDESRKESNRAQARHIAVKLRMVGCALAPLQSWDATKDSTFSTEEVEKLAVAEHNRWWDDHLADGWRLIPMPVGKDEAEITRLLEEAKLRKESPYLIPWDDLLAKYPEIANYDRIFVRGIPDLLASVGLRVIRTDTKTTLPAAASA
jgi:TrkA-N domain